MKSRLADPRTRFLPVNRLSPAVQGKQEPVLAWCPPTALARRLEASEPILLGGRGDDVFFAIDVTGIEGPEDLGLGAAEFPDLRAVASRLSAEDASIAAQARHLVDWHSRHGFCPGCGQPTTVKDAGWARFCPSCSTEHFPRTDPVAIMLVRHGDRCLLGRQKIWPRPFFSALAGFVEAGETLEETVRREVREEAGIEVAAVSYHSSQPWPFPASLMLGCMAEAATDEIRVDDSELEEARWFTREEVVQALRRPSDVLSVPPRMAIAHQLLRAWIDEG